MKVVRPLLPWRRTIAMPWGGRHHHPSPLTLLAHAVCWRVPHTDVPLALCHETALGPPPGPHTVQVARCERCIRILERRGLWPLDTP